MSTQRIGVLLALSSLQQILGSVALGQPTVPLSPPRNVTLLSKDFGMVLTWLPGEGSPPDVLYTVRYQRWDHLKHWEKVQHCRNISQTTCNLTCVPDLYNKFSARVKARSAGRRSPWVESGVMEYHFDVELAPPTLKVSVTETTINVSATFPLASCVNEAFIGLKYDLDFWEAGTEDKQKQYYDNMKQDKVTINTSVFSGNYCLSARASFQAIQLKHSKFSKPVCVLLKTKAMDWKFLITIAVPLLVMLFLCAAAASILCLGKQAAKREKRPQALDFSHFRAPRKILEKETSEKEFFEEALVCLEKPALGGRRSGPSVRNNVSLKASLLSLWEEEEEDDSSSFRPYTEMPRFPKRAPNSQAASTSHQGSHLSSELGGSHLEGGSLSNLAGLEFSQLVWRRGSAEEDTSGFQDSEKSFLSESSSLGDFSLIEARYPATSGNGQHVCQGDTFLQVTVLMEGLNGKPLVSEDSEGFPLDGPLVCFQTLKLAEDEGIASDSDSLTVCSEDDPPPLASVVSEIFETETRGKGDSLQQESDPKFKFQGYQHVHYMPRN
ncbi:unnamed protein product [Lepidochelys kempii]